MDVVKKGALEFLSKTLPEEFSPGQELDQKTAFYAGFYYCLTFMTGTVSFLPDDDAESALVLANAEVQEYFERLEHGFDRNEVHPAGPDPS